MIINKKMLTLGHVRELKIEFCNIVTQFTHIIIYLHYTVDNYYLFTINQFTSIHNSSLVVYLFVLCMFLNVLVFDLCTCMEYYYLHFVTVLDYK